MLTQTDVDITAELATRPERAIDPRHHRRALAALARVTMEEPGAALSRLSEAARALAEAGSSGITLDGGDPRGLAWHAPTGRFAAFAGTILPRDCAPVGIASAGEEPVLLAWPDRACPDLAAAGPMPEVLLVPIARDNGAPALLWVAHHEQGRRFDSGDARRLAELAALAGIAPPVAGTATASAGHARYRSLFDTIDAGFCVIEMRFDADGRPADYRFLEFNHAFEEQTGLHGAEGRWMRDLAPDHEQHWFDIYGRVALTGEPVRFENAADELGRWYDVHAYRIDAPEKGHVALLFNDITARRRAETQLAVLNSRLEQEVAARTLDRDRLWQISRDPFLIADLEGRWLRVSPAWSDILGWSQDELLGRTSQWMEHPDDHAVTRAEIAALDGGRTTLRFENRFRTAAGAYRWFSWTAVRADDLLYCVARDVTEARVQAEALQQAEERMRQSQKVEAVGQLTGGVAHDFNNLLTVIRGSVDLLRRPGVSEERRKRYIDAIADTADRATKLTSQLLAFARRQTLKAEVFDAGANVGALRDMVGTLTGSRVAVAVDVGDAPCLVRADRSQFDTAIVNMAVNARDAMGGEGRLSIRVFETGAMPAVRSHAALDGAFVAVAISDTGTGIPPDQIDRIFEPFFTTKGVGKGTGLGLSQVFGFAKQSGGDVTVESDAGRGTTFTLYLPRALDDRAPASGDAGAGNAALAPGACILVVEDNAEVGSFATTALRELGYRTTLATDGANALAALGDDHGFDVVFSDVVMPGMSGIELAQEIRRRFPALPVVLTSGYSTVLAESGAHGFDLLQKPYSMDELSQALRRVAQPPEDQPSPAM